MNKKLTAKIQKINPKIAGHANNIANSLVVTPDDDATLEKKGTIYTTFGVSNAKELDTLLITKIVNDILHDSYYQSETASPIQAIEKTILKLRDNLAQDAETVFNIATAVLWGNTLYLVQYGNTKIHLVRDGKVKPIEAATEGKFSIASGVVKDNDVVILATNNFAQKYPAEKLVGGNADIDDLDELEACLILKFIIVKEFSEEEVIKFDPPEKPQELDAAANTQTSRAKGITLPKITMPKVSMPKVALPTLDIDFKAVLTSRRLLALVAIVTALIVLGVGIKWYASRTSSKDILDVNGSQNINQVDSTLEADTNGVVSKQTLVKKTNAAIFYDIKLTDTQALPTKIAYAGGKVYVLDVNGKMFVSQAITPKFIALETTFDQVNTLNNHKSSLVFTDNTGFKILDSDNKIANTYLESNLGITATYLDFIYSISGDKLTRYSKAENALTGSLWTQNAALVDALDIGIDYSIYVLTKTGDILKFSTGKQDTFALTGLEKAFKNPTRLITNSDLKNMYILDNGNGRIVVLNKEGKFIKEIEIIEQGGEEILGDMGVGDDETKAYVLIGTKVYEITL